MELILAGILFCVLLFWLVDGILKKTGWTDLQERRAAETFIFASMMNKTPKGK